MGKNFTQLASKIAGNVWLIKTVFREILISFPFSIE